MATRKKPFWIRTELSDVAAFFDVSIQTVDRYWVKSGMPGLPGAYDLKEIHNWRIRQKSGSGEVARGDLEVEKLEEEIRYKRLKNDQTEGILVDRQAAEQEINSMLVRLKTRLEAAPDEMEMRFPGDTRADNKAEFQNYVHNLLKEMASWASKWDQEISSAST